MPFSSTSGGSSRRPTTWTTSLLPTTTAKPRPKPRRRTALNNNIITFLLLSLLLILSLFLYLSLPKSRSPTTRGTRKPVTASAFRHVIGSSSSSNVDITTKGLYDGIKFDDVDGGPWKQGWRVGYKGDEWDDEKLKVFVVPHSHNDPGWKLTVEEYYDKQSRHILDTIVDTLLKVASIFSIRLLIRSPRLYNDPGWKLTGDEYYVFLGTYLCNDRRWKLTVEDYYHKQSTHILDTILDTLWKDVRRKFIWEEMSYLERWWRDASGSKKESFIRLVKSGQLEIVGGGWVMNDEANSHFFAIIEQIMEGNIWLNDTVGVVPKNSWAIDPFGYSSTMAYLLRRMGFENMLIQRTHYELKKELASKKNLEYIWRQSWDAEETTDIFVHMMPFYSYDVPHTCGPEPAICCQFDFARMRGFVYELCPWGEHPVETNQENVKERALLLLDQYKKKSTLYRTNTLLVPLGDDFRYISIDEAEAQFRNYQLLFDYINSDPSLKTEAKFGTLEDYFQTLREEADRVNYSRPGEMGSNQVGGFPSLSGDFFTYADRQQDYWSGYYVSRPFFKAVDRVLEHTLRASEMMMAFLLSSCERLSCEKLPTGFAYKLTAARRNLALFQHHDGVTGTAKDHVVEDYGTRMHTSLQDLQIFLSKAIEVLIGIRHEKSDSPAQLEPAQVRSKYDVQPVHKVIIAHDKSAHSVVLFNPSEQTRDEVVMVVTDRADLTVLNSNWTCVKSQVSPEFTHDKNKIFTGRHRLYWKASIPPLGLEVYYVAKGFVGCEKAKHAKLKLFSKGKKLPCPSPYVCSKLESETAEIRNKRQTLTFDTDLGTLQKISRDDGSENIIGEEISMYSSSDSGAYLFKPNGDAEPIIQSGGDLVVSEGPLVQEVYSNPKTQWDKNPISHSTRIYSIDNIQQFLIEKEYHVELNNANFNDKELIVRYKTDLDNKRVFYSDLNGFQMSRRETYDKIPLQGNYYPMPSLAYIQGLDGKRFSVHTRQSLGVAGLKNGWLEIMLDRRLLQDDGRGLGQGVTDNRPMNVIFHILLESNISSTLDPVSNPHPLSPSLLSHRVGAHLNYPLLTFIAKKPQDISIQPPPRSFSPMSSSLPCDLHIVNFKIPRPAKYTQQPQDPRFVMILQRWHWDSSYCHKGRSHCSSVANEPINLFDVFKGLNVSNVKPTSLNLLHDDTEVLGYTEQENAQEGHVLIAPMEIQAYKMELRPQE